MGQTTSFASDEIKSTVLVMGENKSNGEARYIHGIRGKGFLPSMVAMTQRIISIG